MTLRVLDGDSELGSALLQVSQLQMNRKMELKLQLQRLTIESAESDGAVWALEQELAVEAAPLEEKDRTEKYVETAVSTARDSRAQGKTNRQLPSKRVLESSTAQGKFLNETKTPWCSREWQSGSSLLAEPLDFAVRDAPSRAKNGDQTKTGEHGGKIYAQLWCETARQWRLLPASARDYQRRSYRGNSKPSKDRL